MLAGGPISGSKTCTYGASVQAAPILQPFLHHELTAPNSTLVTCLEHADSPPLFGFLFWLDAYQPIRALPSRFRTNLVRLWVQSLSHPSSLPPDCICPSHHSFRSKISLRTNSSRQGFDAYRGEST